MPEETDATTQVWLIEDNDSFRNSVQRAVNELEGLSCEGSFPSAEAAFAELDRGIAPDVILLDVQLPGQDGISALAGIRRQAPQAKVLILTVFDDPDKIFRAVCAGAAGYILKGAGLDEIAEGIRQLMDGGAPMTPSVAKKVLEVFAKTEGDPSLTPKTGVDYKLTGREQEILRLMADGLIKKEIALRLEISVHTVSTHLRSVYEKLRVNTNTGAVAKALREGII